MDGIIYGAMCTANQKWYIGQTTVGLETRRRQHLKAARNNRDSCVFHAAIRKYGEDAWDWTVLEFDIKTHDELNEREKFWIREKNAFVKDGGYNMNFGGNGTANHPKNFTPWNKGKKNCYSAETRKRISITNKGKKRSEETRKRMSITNKGKGAKPVLMFNRNGDFVAEFPSVTAAAEYLSVSTSPVSAVLTGKHKFTGGGFDKNAGYTFRYKENPDR